MSFSWSLSALTLFERCKFAYKCRYVSKIPDLRPLGGPAQRGIETHKNIELNLQADYPLTAELENKWGPAFREVKQYPLQIEHKIALNRSWEPTSWGDAWCRMVLDLKVKRPQNYTVYDWKTGKEYPEHYEQKELYALGVIAEHPEEKIISAVHVYLDLGKQTKREYHRDQMPARRAQWETRAKKVEDYVTANDQGQWVMEPNFLCRWCAFSKSNGGPCKF